MPFGITNSERHFLFAIHVCNPADWSSRRDSIPLMAENIMKKDFTNLSDIELVKLFRGKGQKFDKVFLEL